MAVEKFGRLELFPVERHIHGDRECLPEHMHYMILVGGINSEERWVRIGEYDHVPQALDVFRRLTGKKHPRHDEFERAWKRIMSPYADEVESKKPTLRLVKNG